MVLSWLAGRLLGYAMARLSAGDPRVVIALYGPKVELTFPGENSFSGAFRGKAEVSRWLRRFAAIGFAIVPEQVVAVGPPWSTTVATRVHVTLHDDAGEQIYDNRGVIWGQLVWGRMRRYEVFEDTLPAAVIDPWVAEHKPALATV